MAAEDSLASARRQPQCTLSVLGLLTQEQVPLQVRQAAAVFFKNAVRQHWEPEDEHELTIPDEIKTQARFPVARWRAGGRAARRGLGRA